MRLRTLAESCLKEVLSQKLVANTSEEIVIKAKKLKDGHPEKDSAGEKWVAPREFGKHVLTWGHSFANGRITLTAHHTDKEVVEDLDNDISLRECDLYFSSRLSIFFVNI